MTYQITWLLIRFFTFVNRPVVIVCECSVSGEKKMSKQQVVIESRSIAFHSCEKQPHDKIVGGHHYWQDKLSGCGVIEFYYTFFHTLKKGRIRIDGECVMELHMLCCLGSHRNRFGYISFTFYCFEHIKLELYCCCCCCCCTTIWFLWHEEIADTVFKAADFISIITLSSPHCRYA